MGRGLKRWGAWRVACGAAVVVAAVVGTATVPAGAASGGSISGSVVDGGGKPLSGICVNVENGPGVQTDASGAYSIYGLGAGSYKIQYSDCNAIPQYVTQWYFGRPDSGSADLVSVADGVDTPLQPVPLALGFSVRGTVTDTNGNPLAGISVNVNPTNPGPVSAGTQTDARGSYVTSPLRSGDYKVQFSDNGPTPTWARQYWKQKPSWNTADTLSLNTTGGPVQGGIDAKLSAAAKIEGTVTGPDGSPLSGICVDANVANSGGYDFVQGATTASDGTYTIGQLPAADLRVHFHVCNGGGPYEDQWYDTKGDFNNSTAVVLAAGDDRHGINAQLATGVSVAGRVTDGNGNPIPGISVSVNPTNQGSGGYAQTDANGNYTTSTVTSGDYKVQFSDNGPTPAWARQYWNAKPSWNTADTLTLNTTGGPVQGGIDAQLSAAATITGTVTAPGGGPGAKVCVNANVDSPNGPDQVGNTTTAPDGTYTLGGLPATAVKIDFQDCNSVGPYVEQWWNNQPDSSSAQALTLTPGETRPRIDATLAAAAEITGTVTDPNGNPLGGICAQATTTTFVGGLAHTDPNGNYVLSLAKPGQYRVQFVDCNQTPAFAGQWWDSQPSSATAKAVTVAAGQIIKGVNAKLSPGALGTISGKVVNLHGIAMTTACVVAYLPNQYAVFAPVNADGTYKITNVPSGTYALGFLGCNGGNPSPTLHDPESTATSYNGVWWDGAPIHIDQNTNGGPDPIAQGANLVTVTPGQDLSGYDRCFGCTAISIWSITPGTGSLTVAFRTPGLVTSANVVQDGASTQASPLTYTVECTSTTGGAPGSANGPNSPITVSGLTPSATYTCHVTASDGRTTVGASAVSNGVDVPASPGASNTTTPANVSIPTPPLPSTLARTGTSSPTTLTRTGLTLLGLGLGLLAATRHHRRAWARNPSS
jgi:protocatechuate 3,4-dioxygenase beta subunit